MIGLVIITVVTISMVLVVPMIVVSIVVIVAIMIFVEVVKVVVISIVREELWTVWVRCPIVQVDIEVVDVIGLLIIVMSVVIACLDLNEHHFFVVVSVSLVCHVSAKSSSQES